MKISPLKRYNTSLINFLRHFINDFIMNFFYSFCKNIYFKIFVKYRKDFFASTVSNTFFCYKLLPTILSWCNSRCNLFPKNLWGFFGKIGVNNPPPSPTIRHGRVDATTQRVWKRRIQWDLNLFDKLCYATFFKQTLMLEVF